ncbi:MAG: hypothetical protein LBF57_03515 [Holosporaceae bacterium]|jgi:SH3-like domain-containing protein|nr:hypothetical protein [Holosporaceae bacterium]
MKFWFLAFILVLSSRISAEQFASLKSSQVNIRVGPGKEYPVSWILIKPNLPVILIAEFDQWRKIKLIDETEGWVHQNMISQKNTAVVKNNFVILYRYESDSQPIAKIEKNVVIKVLKRNKDWIKIEVNKIKGWVKKQGLWGVGEE